MPRKTVAITLLVFVAAIISSAKAQSFSDVEINFHSLVPLGAHGFQLPSHHILYLMASALSPHFEGWKTIQSGSSRIVLAPDGSAVRYFPEAVRFRISATALQQQMLDVSTVPLDVADLNEFLLGLRFRLKIFRGLQVRYVEPQAVEMIGMPAEVPYEERVFSASFTLGRVPIDDRIVLEVLEPSGERLCKFHLEF